MATTWRKRTAVAAALATAALTVSFFAAPAAGAYSGPYRVDPSDGLAHADFAEPNGCGGGPTASIVPDRPMGIFGPDFTTACNNHDRCYATLGMTQAQCDGRFLVEMLGACYAYYPFYNPLRDVCAGIAAGYAGAVIAVGAPFYWHAQYSAAIAVQGAQAQAGIEQGAEGVAVAT